jgi:predicted ATP-grasp superfamily ATP-dependent carboligase
LDVETFNVTVHLPSYQTPENDYRGENKLMEVVGSLYELPVPQEVVEKAKEQEEQFKRMAEQFLLQQPQLRVILSQLEENYDARVKDQKQEIHLSPEVEKFLKEMNGRFEQG